MNKDYFYKAILELRDQQVRFAPRDKKIEQANRAEKLLAEMDDARDYSYEYIIHRVTNFRPESAPVAGVKGEKAKHDLRLLVEDLTDAADVAADRVGERVLTVDDLSKMFNVSTKTIARWREQGLVSRRFVFGKRKRVGFLQSSVERFVSCNGDRIRRSASFSQMTDDERNQIVDKARRMAAAGGCSAEITRRLSEIFGRSPETIRYTLKQYDELNPSTAIFPEKIGPLTELAKQRIYQQFKHGATVDALSKQFCRTRASIYRVLNEMRAQWILDLPLDCIYNQEFDKAGAEKEILAPMPELKDSEKSRKVKTPSGLPPYLAGLYEVPLLTREQEAHLFRKFNFLKHRAAKLRTSMDPHRPKSSVMDDVERYYELAASVKNQLTRANLRLVVSIAKRHVGQHQDNFFELVSDGNMSLIRAVEKFDYSRGFKFSTYATWAIMKNFARTIPDEYKHQDRFKTSSEEKFTATEDYRLDPHGMEVAQTRREAQVERILDKLDEREQKIIMSRFGLEQEGREHTLKEVGVELGVTKERIRQLEARALNKLRKAAEEEQIDFFSLD